MTFLKRVLFCTAILPISFSFGFSPSIAEEPSIRQFDIPTIEALGQAMYAQDQEAWKATDAMRAQHSDEELHAQKLHGWITEKTARGDVIRFVRDGANGPEAFCDVEFANGLASACSVPPDTTLTPDEIAQFNARTLALSNIERSCSDRYNSIALKDPQGDSWLVWALAATTDPDLVIVGGHYRFTISANGKSILQKDALSKSCLKLDKHTQGGRKAAGNLMNQIVSLSPLETYVFANLSYKSKFYVGTLDGKVWKVDQGHVTTVEEDAPEDDGFAARALAGTEEQCRSILTKSQDGKPVFYIGDSVNVISATEGDKKFALDAPTGSAVAGIGCSRLNIAPAPNDYKVILAGYTLTIFDRGVGHPNRSAELEIVDGRLQFRFVKGALTDDIQTRVTARLDALQKAIQAKP
jgi:hypothetical protein